MNLWSSHVVQYPLYKSNAKNTPMVLASNMDLLFKALQFVKITFLDIASNFLIFFSS